MDGVAIVGDKQGRVSDGEAVGEEIAELRLRPAPEEELGGQVQVGARVDAEGDAGRDDGQDCGGALTAEVYPSEEPVAATEHELPNLSLDAIVGELDLAVRQKEHEPPPLAVEIAERLTERRARRRGSSLRLQPLPESFNYRGAVFFATRKSLLGSVTRLRTGPLHGEERCDPLEPFEGDLVARACRQNETAPAVAPAARALPTGALEKVGDARAVALHAPLVILAEEALDAVGISLR